MAQELPYYPEITYDFSKDIYITNLPTEFHDLEVLTELGILSDEDVKLHRISFDRHLGSCRRVVVRYKTQETRDTALNRFQSLKVFNKDLVVFGVKEHVESLKELEISVKKKYKGEKFAFEHSILVYHDSEVNNNIYETFFKKFGTIKNITRPNHPKSSKLIIITFAFFSEALAAEMGLNGVKLQNSEMMVEVMRSPLAVRRQLRILDMLWSQSLVSP